MSGLANGSEADVQSETAGVRWTWPRKIVGAIAGCVGLYVVLSAAAWVIGTEHTARIGECGDSNGFGFEVESSAAPWGIVTFTGQTPEAWLDRSEVTGRLRGDVFYAEGERIDLEKHYATVECLLVRE